MKAKARHLAVRTDTDSRVSSAPIASSGTPQITRMTTSLLIAQFENGTLSSSVRLSISSFPLVHEHRKTRAKTSGASTTNLRRQSSWHAADKQAGAATGGTSASTPDCALMSPLLQGSHPETLRFSTITFFPESMT